MRIGIVTIYDLSNYGNRLQNYATVYLLKKMGIESETVIVDYDSWTSLGKKFIKKLLKRKENYNWIQWNLRQENQEYVNSLSSVERLQYDKFKKFSDRYIPIRYVKCNPLSSKKDLQYYDYFLAGSDQIWNPELGQAEDWEFLCFAEHKKRIAWCASFGVTQISDSQKRRVKKRLRNMRLISVRESAGRELVQKMIGVSPAVIVDPTLLLNREDWERIAARPPFLADDEYVLTYFLGPISAKANIDLDTMQRKYSCKVIQMMNKDFSDYYASGPDEFIYLIAHAKAIFTDSFHASVFSFIFDRPFMVYPREGNGENMLSRINTFLDKFKLKNNFCSELSSEWIKADYSLGKCILMDEQKKAMNYLNCALEISDEN